MLNGEREIGKKKTSFLLKSVLIDSWIDLITFSIYLPQRDIYKCNYGLEFEIERKRE